jgi:hypothetical protein
MGRQLVITDFDALTWLQGWYAENCDGEWEKARGITLATTDTPGWYLSINLEETELERRAFTRIDHNRQGDESWWICQVGQGHFLAACAPHDLASVIAVFKDWAEA